MRYLQLLIALTVMTLSSYSYSQCGGPVPLLLCDADGNFDVNINDIEAISLARGTPATEPSDIRDIDGDGMITILDARQCVAQCSVPDQCVDPERTAWEPVGPRSVPYIGDAGDPAGGDVLGNPASYFRGLHADSINSDQVAIATPPVFEQGWVAEPEMRVGAGPIFDQSGNVYFSPGRSDVEDVFLVALNPDDGSRRWKIEGVTSACGSPLLLDDPDNPGEQILYSGCYDRAVAVKPDADTNLDKVVETGEMIWDVSTGLTVTPGESPPTMFGLNYDPTTDTIIGLAQDNHLFVLDRKTGVPLLSAPYSLPDIAPSADNTPDDIPQSIIDAFGPRLDVLLGNGILVANFFSVDPHTGKIWVAATAPDGDDGALDGVSELGAVYSLKLVPDGTGLFTVDRQFYTSFLGGTASTPALSADGQKVYVGDNFGKLVAIDASDGSIVWEHDVDDQIFGSISVASDNNEIYAVTTNTIIKVIDNGTSATESWRATLDMYPETDELKNVNLVTASIVANGIAFQAASADFLYGILPESILYRLPLPQAVGVGLLDRETGEIRHYTEGREESVGVPAIGPDGSIYIGNSPARRSIAVNLNPELPPITGGIQKFPAKRLDLLARDAVHAASDRAKNVSVNGAGWSSDVKEIEVKQIGLLIEQTRTAAVIAVSDGHLAAATWTTIDGYLTAAESALSLAIPDFAIAHQNLQQADSLL
jgi:outer membrane protein assembly factor BamB